MNGTWTGLLLLVQAAAVVLGIVVAYSAARNARTSQGAVGWVVFLVSFPLAALPAYAVFGRIGFGSYIDRRRAADALQRRDVALGDHGWDRLRTTDALSPFPVVVGNRLHLLTDGHAFYDAVIRAIEAAEHEALVQFYIVRDDPEGRRLADALIAAAQRGVRARFMWDALGSLFLSRQFLDRLRRGGVEAHLIKGPKRPIGRLGLNFRNHRKTVVIDGRVAFTGGHNLGREYVDGGRRFAAWRDTSVRVEGPVAWQLREIFAQDWAWTADAPLGQPEGTPDGTPDGTP
ncbi:MAG: phospholipase D-like domain-containing protein, partial [Pseudomonadota bacterium]